MNGRALALIAGGITLILAAGAGIGFWVYSMVTQPSTGYVKALDYEPASSVYVPGYYSPGYCSGSGAYRTCYPGVYHAGYSVYYPQEWSIEVCRKPIDVNAGNACGWRDVDQLTYHSVSIGEYWPSQNHAPVNTGGGTFS